MQLFITVFEKKWEEIFVDNKAIVDQIKKVLRGKIWDKIAVQHAITVWQKQENTEINTRYILEITTIEKNHLTGKILKTERQYHNQNNPQGQTNDLRTTTLFVAMPNKRSKAELIAQKLTEIGIDRIIFWQAERSVIKWYNTNKIQRILNISREASEQSRRWTLPEIFFLEDEKMVKKYLEVEWQEIFVFDIPRETEDKQCKIHAKHNNTATVGIIWPEWWLTAKDYQKFWTDYQCIALGETVLRMETASIIGAWELKKIN